MSDLDTILDMDESDFEAWLVEERARGEVEFRETLAKAASSLPTTIESRPLTREDLEHAHKVLNATPNVVTPRRLVTEDDLRFYRQKRRFHRGDDITNEVCLNCNKHIRNHYGGTEYRCHPKT